MLERFFQLREHETTPVREVLAGLTTFLTMAYILFVQPNVLSKDFAGQPTGLDAGAVLLATCLASALATALMGLLAKLPIGLAPGMGQNFFFVAVIMSLAAQDFAQPWQTALGIVFVAGVIFVVLSLIGIRKAILDTLSHSLTNGVAVGIGLFIAFIGLKNGGVVAEAPTLVALNAKGLLSPESAVFWTGLVVTLILTVWKVPGGILLGIASSTLMATLLGQLKFDGVLGLPEIQERAAFALNLRDVFTPACLPFVVVFLFMDVFDTMGTLVGVTQQAGLIKDGKIPRAQQAMLADSIGTVAGAALGTSTVTCYIESAAGVQQGGRTGLTALTVAALFLLALPLSPLIVAIGAYLPITAPALVVVGSMMFRNVVHIEWSDETEAIPAFLIVLGIPLFFSIADGMALGFIAWPLLKFARGRGREASWLAYGLAVALVAYFLLVRINT